MARTACVAVRLPSVGLCRQLYVRLRFPGGSGAPCRTLGFSWTEAPPAFSRTLLEDVVAFMVLWIQVTSQLGHYSKLFGPQILLQLNLAFYLPSIPILLLSGSLERSLDARVGPIGSIALRLHAGLAACLALAALFPLLPGFRPGTGALWPLLTAVAALGGASAVAFSTSYQLVQYFRWDEHELSPSGLCFVCWISMYEICAGFILAGLLSSSSLCVQYWSKLTGAATAADGGAATAADGDDSRVPLLAAAAAAYDDCVTAGAAAADGDVEAAANAASPPRLRLLIGAGSGSGGYGSPGSPYNGHLLRRFGSVTTANAAVNSRLSYRVQSYRSPGVYRRGPTTAPDPFNVFSLLTPRLDGGFEWDDDDDDDSAPPVLFRRSASAGVVDSSGGSTRSAAAARRRREALAAVAAAGGWSRNRIGTSPYIKPSSPPCTPTRTTTVTATAAASPGRGGGGAAAADSSPITPRPRGLIGMASAPATMVWRPGGGAHGDGGGGEPVVSTGDDGAAATASGGGGRVRGVLEFGIPDEEPLAVQQSSSTAAAVEQEPEGQLKIQQLYGTRVSSFASQEASEQLAKALQIQNGCTAAQAEGAGGGAAANEKDKLPPPEGSGGLASAEAPPPLPAAAVAVALSPPPLTLRQEVVEVVRASWQVMLGFTLDVTLLYIVFPFFTYVPASGWLGDNLPQVLFYSRLFTDFAGRLLPRCRALQIRSGTAVLLMSAVAMCVAALFLLYILAPPRLVAKAPGLLRNDVVPLALVVFLWITGGYINTMSNMLAPSQAPPHLAGRASAMMALLFNVAHIGGLIIAAGMAAFIFGDVVG
ncbi:hypothetical protein VOLCADRAFT_99745 [Volvox carteri f. nagariensis]|uniref:Uncharacterized protein n=1 Tax=Volvox carteri f. nagariensis TaxID=3068 RepID=D8UIJ5_VOLCA|nr:uncharacterized protein VOLCADRAFT_99745 [Volvox carteri f. nagariensis]EFJ40464.1 hypothetical protein VOLCADRAFT_99745 [Volvox carteri f. nagariensis]|eukprot:XP_002958464.1 hypothetical protein VOLCADRAFT_99745 [Volvox carteri f. nagariensis]